MKKNRRQIIRSKLTGFGAKFRACSEFGLHEFIPRMTRNSQIYVEPFFFSGTMFFNLKEVRSAVINDKCDLVWNFWQVVAAKRRQLEAEMRYVWNGKKWFDEYQQRTDDVGKAVYLYLMNRSSHKGIMETKFRYKYFNHPLEKDFGLWEQKLNALASLSIWRDDFRVVFKRLIEKGTDNYTFVWYQDPPYYNVDRYLVNFTEQDHIDLAALNNQLRTNPAHHILLSYNDVPFIRELYKDWYIMNVEWYVPAKDTEQTPETKGEEYVRYHELLISNRPFKRYQASTIEQWT